MAVIKPFKALRPSKELTEKVASLPYDVMNRKEAKEMAKGNDISFLHVVRSEMDVPEEMSQYDEKVYLKAKENLDKFEKDGVLVQDNTENLYIYRQIMNGRVQTGIVACTSVDEYLNNTIKKHEFTRPEKEQDRINNFDYCDANTAPIFLTYKKNDKVNSIINDWIKFHNPEFNFTTEDDITHIGWVIDNSDVVKEITDLFAKIDYLYIADGHHRSASSSKVALKRREQFPNYDGTEEFNYFMSVIFPDDDLFIMDYNRVVQDLNGNDVKSFLEKISEKFDVQEVGKDAFKPSEPKTFGMFLDNNWYKLTAKPGTFNSEDPVLKLDVSVLQNNLLNPILGIDNPRTNTRIDFVGGLRGLIELEKRVNEGMAVAFSMYPTTMDDLIGIADANEVMPPKSTWFEPKLRSGLFTHKLS